VPLGPVLVVTGAGATHLLGGNQQTVPLMSTWAGDIWQRLGQRGFGLADTLGLQPNMTGEEFERQLGRFLAWERGLTTTSELADLGEEDISTGSPKFFSKWIAKARQNAELINDAIFESLYVSFGLSAISPYAAMAAYKTLIELLRIEGHPGWLTVATTNYDFAAEEALQQLDWRPYWGEDSQTSTTGASPPVHLANLANATALERTPILHLHGRIGWYRQPDGQLVSMPPSVNYSKDYGTPGLLLPDPHKNYEEDMHFRIMWDEFRKAIEQATRILVLGHSLNDAGLCKALAPAIGNRLRVSICVDSGEGSPAYQEELGRILGLLPGLSPGALIPMKFGPDFVPDGTVRGKFQEWNG